ncbi:protein GUCD1-like [Ctenocephalides felis]|uniref:protein GUCD1-like n=1 Tax=Ctenocephalides felis TaxID=7515 RepID=UPI000E6E5A9F|nr:protein GUCD1-like [Ctenocephalides felis]XP_026475011.1 protein GUCD1-like [Ctenocephalides felis]
MDNILDDKLDDSNLPLICEQKLVHFKQRYTWDCGISCILMILPFDSKEYFLQKFYTICNDEGFSKSTWTIDLCYLLKRFKIKHTYFTITFGVNPGYQDELFYEKIITKDESRVLQRFNSAASLGIKIKVKNVSTIDLLKHLYKFGTVILLINANLLHCDICKRNKSDLRSCLPWTKTYSGHYIVLCGFNLETKSYMYRNPTYKDRVCVMSFQYMDEARMSYGTDQDTIFIFNK